MTFTPAEAVIGEVKAAPVRSSEPGYALWHHPVAATIHWDGDLDDLRRQVRDIYGLLAAGARGPAA